MVESISLNEETRSVADVLVAFGCRLVPDTEYVEDGVTIVLFIIPLFYVQTSKLSVNGT